VVQVPAIVVAGEGRAAKAVYGQPKVYLEVGGRALVARVVAVLQRVPEVSEVWVVGNAAHLETVLGESSLQAELRKPVVVVQEFRNLLENGWQTYRRLLSGAGPQGRDPDPADDALPVLYLSGDLPFATPQEISCFVRRSLEGEWDYSLGLCTAESLRPFAAEAGQAGMDMAVFNVAGGRFRQSNLHLIRPGRIGNRQVVEEMYEHRYQKQFGNVIALAWRLLRRKGGGLWVMLNYAVMVLAGWADRHGLRRLRDLLRGLVPFSRLEKAISRLMGARYRFVVTELGGCAADVDSEADFDVCRLRFDAWTEQQRELAERCYGPLPLPEGVDGPAPKLRRLEDGRGKASLAADTSA